MSIPQCIILEIPDTLIAFYNFNRVLLEIPNINCIVGMLLTCPIIIQYNINSRFLCLSPPAAAVLLRWGDCDVCRSLTGAVLYLFLLLLLPPVVLVADAARPTVDAAELLVIRPAAWSPRATAADSCTHLSNSGISVCGKTSRIIGT